MRSSLSLLALVPLALAACTAAPATLTLTATPVSIPADGVSTVSLVATVSPADAAAVLSFTIEGIGDLAASNVPVVDGKATVTLMAPMEEQLEVGAAPTTVRASMPSTGLPIEATTTITYAVPTTGAASLDAYTESEVIVVATGQPHILIIAGRRLTVSTVTLRDDSDSVDVPATATLEGDDVEQIARVEIPAPATAQVVNVTVSAEGLAPVTTAVRFINEGDPEFDLSGTFAQIQYGSVRISNFGLLANDPDCVRAENINLVTIEQNGNELTMITETCALTMPGVRIANPLGNPIVITPRPGPGWVQAANDHDSGPVTFTLDSVEAGASFDVPPAAFGEPMVVGAELADKVNSPLPSDPNDVNERDHDGDDEPGVTIKGEGLVGDQHICYRNTVLSMTGTIESSSVIHGVMENQQESSIYGGSLGDPVVTGLPTPFHLQRVDGAFNAPNIASRAGDPSTITCEDVAAYASEMRLRFTMDPLPADRCPNNPGE